MADYFSPTVIQQPIPIADMTLLERLVLSLIFEAEPGGEALRFHTRFGPSDVIGLSIADLRPALEASAGIDSAVAIYVAERLAAVPVADTEIEIDFSGTSWEFIFQDIVRRSPTLSYVTAVTSFTCSKPRPDAFGGMAVLITADAIMGKSTTDILEDFVSAMEDGEPGAPGLAEALQHMLDVFDHCGLRGLVLTSGKRHGWTRAAVDRMSDACDVAKMALQRVGMPINGIVRNRDAKIVNPARAPLLHRRTQP
ncbi:MAG TPA: hypothetical protein VKI44_09175 [Acetobacteraceae bacterium]|nr:hypothetical protein [Acetobacteraceae bacterium]